MKNFHRILQSYTVVALFVAMFMFEAKVEVKWTLCCHV